MTLTKPSSAIDAVTEDAFLGDRLIMRQPLKGYRAGIDAVLLAAIVSEVGDTSSISAQGSAPLVYAPL